MKISEIISEKDESLNEKLGLGWLGSAVWGIFKAFNIGTPIVTAWKNMKAANDAYNQKQPGYTAEKVNQIQAHELAKCSAEVAAMIIGNKLIDKMAFGILKFKDYSPVAAYLSEVLSTIGQAKFMMWMNSEEVITIISNWLTGVAFSEKFPLLNKSGPLYEKYVGGGILGALRAANPYVEKAKEKTLDKIMPPTTTPPSGQGASTTPATDTTHDIGSYTYLQSQPSTSGDPNKFNIGWKR